MAERMHDPECEGELEFALNMDDFTIWLMCRVCDFKMRDEGLEPV